MEDTVRWKLISVKIFRKLTSLTKELESKLDEKTTQFYNLEERLKQQEADAQEKLAQFRS